MTPTCFRISPLIRYSLFGLYGSLTLPLPFLLIQHSHSWLQMTVLLTSLVVGGILLSGALSQRVEVDPEGVKVTYPRWVPTWLQQGWQLSWTQITDIDTSSTSQGGLAYYLVAPDQGRYLLPMRVQGFKTLLAILQAQTGQDTRSLYPYVQPWMYLALALCAGILLICDLGVIGLVLMS